MKKIRFIILMLLSIVFSSTYAQTDSTATFKVFGACGMCKQRIEKSLKVKGIAQAKWDIASNMLSVTYNSTEISLNDIHKKVAAVGHDTEKEKASKDVYDALPDCCHYREAGAAMDAVSTMDTMALHTPAVRGVVMEEDNKGNFKPLEGASIIWLGTGLGTTSNKHGVFELPLVTGQEQVVVSFAGRGADTVEVKDAQELKIVLSTNNQLKEVRVTASRAATYINGYNPFRTAVMTQKELFKAACCNLSESFETNPAVDVSYNDAVTGSKQIQLLGLSGVYSQLTVENLPGPRGLATSLGLNSIAGPWVESIELTKGAGSVVNGFESIAGQINVELKKPASTDKLHLNGYVNTMGKSDLNLNYAKKLGDKWSTMLLLHDDFLYRKVDQNKDGFVDLPTGNLFSGINRWQYQGTNGLMGQFGVKVLADDRTGGAMNYNATKHRGTTNAYGLGINTRRYEAFGKLGYVFPEKKYQSIGLQLSAFKHNQDSYFGLTNYDGEQQNFYANLIYQSIIGNTNHKFKTGMSFLYDRYNEDLNAQNFKRTEVVPGAFFEYTFSPVEKFNLVAGIRADHNSLFGAFATPRLHLRYQPWTNTTVRASFGRGQRTANIFAENNGALVSARQVQILNPVSGGAYGLEPEVAWNKGISVDQKFKLFGRNATLGVDFFRNDFQNQVVVDFENPRKLQFYNLEGKSYSNSLQAELSVMPVNKLELRLAYRYFDVKTQYGDQLLQKPMTAKHRAFANAAYEVDGWKFDYTVNFIGTKRLPSTEANPHHYMLMKQSPSYTLMNAQVSKTLGKKKLVDVYLGGENLTNFMQEAAVLAADQPFSPYFDASMIWGPVNGRQVYAGFRYTIK